MFTIISERIMILCLFLFMAFIIKLSMSDEFRSLHHIISIYNLGPLFPVPDAVKTLLPEALTASLEINAGFLGTRLLHLHHCYDHYTDFVLILHI